MGSTKAELGWLKPATQEDRTTLQMAQGLLDEGLKTLLTRQKFIKIADRSEYGWATVKHYQDDPLALDSDDEKNLGRAENQKTYNNLFKCYVSCSLQVESHVELVYCTKVSCLVLLNNCTLATRISSSLPSTGGGACKTSLTFA